MYTNLPTLIVAGTLSLGGVTGILPLIIFGLCCAMLWGSAYAVQRFFGGLFGLEHDKLILSRLSSVESNELIISKWIILLIFLYTYIMMNAIAIYNLPIKSEKENEQLIQNRQAYMISCMIAVTLIVLVLLIMRRNIGNEKWWMWLYSLGIGGFAGWGIWNLVTQGGNDLRWGDLFQIRLNLAPPFTATDPSGQTTVLCPVT